MIYLKSSYFCVAENPIKMKLPALILLLAVVFVQSESASVSSKISFLEYFHFKISENKHFSNKNIQQPCGKNH